MSEKVYRCFVEKRPGFDVEAKALQSELSDVLGIMSLNIRIFNRYDIQNLTQDCWSSVKNTVLSEPMCDICFEDNLPSLKDGVKVLCVEPLPGQFDVRSDSCEQCFQMLLGGERPVVSAAKVFVIENTNDTDFERIKAYIINPLESREVSMDKPETLIRTENKKPENVPEIQGFIKLDIAELKAVLLRYELAMSLEDLILVQKYFISKQREPTLAELRVIDTYWSDHCRHTTFGTIIEFVDIQDKRVQKAYDLFLSVNGNKPITLMSVATASMRYLKEQDKLPMLDVSEENNACTVRVKAEFKFGKEDWLLFFKNETHNHPTEIEPFGGASTCIGGAIRDPLSGRAYVYQAMRITGSGDPTKPIEDTLPGKLPQRKLTVTAAEGYSSYGNQIGLATGYVKEIYHNGYIAKRLETGAVVGAAPLSSVRRESPEPGDVVVLLGGRTGRDGIGGATGSSKTHDVKTVSESASEVQKGNAPEERKLQRLFRNPDVTRLIKRCNDFGAGGASVAIGELSDGVEIDLDAIPVKYDGLTGTELAISESQERMAAVVSKADLQALLQHAEIENIEASVIARVTDNKCLTMIWRGQKIVDIDRIFLDTNGAERYASVYVPSTIGTEVQPSDIPRSDISLLKTPPSDISLSDKVIQLAGDLNFCSQKGLMERFDSSIGAASVFMPYGGKYALTETQVMAALLPAKGTSTASVMAYGFDPYFTESDPFGGSAYAVVTSIAKLIASGVCLNTIHLSLQEYFPRVNNNAARWGLPFSALLGAFSAQMGLGIAAIGGKDSMSGSFGDMDVPPTLISFAVGVQNAAYLISPEFKSAGHPVYLLETPLSSDGLPDYDVLRVMWEKYTALCLDGKILSAWACETGGIYGGILKMSLGNMVGFSETRCTGNGDDVPLERQWGSIIFEAAEVLEGLNFVETQSNEFYSVKPFLKKSCFKLLGHTLSVPTLTFREISIPLTKLSKIWESTLESIFPVKTEQSGNVPIIIDKRRASPYRGDTFVSPKAVLPVFPGTNCEYDTAAAIEKAGGRAEIVLVRNLTPQMLKSSVIELEKAIKSAQMVIFPGGFSGGDEPDGSGKFIVSLFRNQQLTDVIHDLLENRDGLILGICNGFQALIKLGLLPYGKIKTMTADCPTLTFNRIGRHQSRYVRTCVSSVLSPWLSKCKPGEIYLQPVSHGEGRFTVSPETCNTLVANGQIAFQYVDDNGVPSMDITYNPNGSDLAVEGICNPDGRILGKMAHSERYGDYVAKNIPGNKYLPLFEGGVNYFK